ncbi:MAG: TIR domain-containing protein [Verrucomicrobiota bacterium]|nr:TIR domain-containing protein [Verrucomicrobiota bacterium]
MSSQSPIQNKRSIFISYRRDDSEDVTGRIYDRLIQKFSPDSIFKDVDNIEAGEDFRKALQHQVAGCRVLLAIVGQHWTDDPRLQDEGDYVRIEVESGLDSERDDILVIPVLVSNASMPSEDQLPDSLKDFTYRNASKVRPDPDFHQDMDKLIKILMDKLHLHDHTAQIDEPRLGSDASGKKVGQTKTGMTRPLGGMEQNQLDESKRLLLKEMDAFGCRESLDSVFDTHRERQDEVGDEIRRLYLLAQIEINPSLTLNLTETILGDTDDPQSYFMQMEYYERTGDKRKKLAVISLAEGKFPNHACVQGGIMKHCLDQYAREKTDSCLAAAKKAFEKIVASGKVEPITRSLRAYYYYRKGDNGAFAKEEEKRLPDEEVFYIRKLRSELNSGRLELEISGTAYDCHHGNILGRKGDIAKAHLSAIPTVHSRHAEVFCCFGQWHIRALPTSQNPTYVDDHLVDPGDTRELTGEHRLRLSTKFEGKLKVVPVNPSERV